MAVIKLRSTRSANRLIDYCDRKAAERDGLNCDPEFAKEQMRMTREEWDKTDGIQAHHVIQSFSPEDEITAQEANELGRRLAEEIAPGHEVAVYTHTDRDHIHNHLVINAVSFEDGHKYHSDREQLFHIREKSNEMCQEKGLDVIREPEARERFSQAEYKLVERGERLWKDELRTAIDDAKKHTHSLDEMKSYLHDRYGIEMKIQNQNVSFLHPEKEKYVRGKTLGDAYSKGAIEHEHGRQRESTAATGDRGLGTDRVLFGGDRRTPDHHSELSGRAERQVREGSQRINEQHERQEFDDQKAQRGISRDTHEFGWSAKTDGATHRQTREGIGASLERGATTQAGTTERLHVASDTRQGTNQPQALQDRYSSGVEHPGRSGGLSDTQGGHKELTAFEMFRRLGQEAERTQNMAKHEPKRNQKRYKSRKQQQKQQGTELDR